MPPLPPPPTPVRVAPWSPARDQRWQRRKVTFSWSINPTSHALTDHPHTFSASVLGTLAVHRQLYGGNLWALSHLPSECAVIHLPNENAALDVGSLLWFVASKALSQPVKGLIDLRLLDGKLGWVKSWLRACQQQGRCVLTASYESGEYTRGA